MISLNSGICSEVKAVVSECQVCYLKEKNNIQFTHAVQLHNAMLTCISQRNVIVSENDVLQNFIENISSFCFYVYILPLVALLAFVYFSEMMNYVIEPVGPKFSQAVSKELISNDLCICQIGR